MDQKMSLVKKYFLYTKERFPLPVMIIYSAAFFYLSYFFAGSLSGWGSEQIAHSLLGWLVIFCSLFHLRLLDEHKDFKKDSVAYPERMLSKGIITLAELRRLLVVLVIVEAAVSAALGLVQFIIWILMFGYSLLMLYEFFASEFLTKRIGLYLITHQLIVPFYLLYGVSMNFDFQSGVGGDWIRLVIFCIGGIFTTMTFEIARKTWSPDREHALADSYTKEWGRGRTVLVTQLLALGTGACFVYLYWVFQPSVVYTIIVAAGYLLFLCSELLFLKKPDRKNSKIVEGMGALYTMSLLIVSAVRFYLAG